MHQIGMDDYADFGVSEPFNMALDSDQGSGYQNGYFGFPDPDMLQQSYITGAQFGFDIKPSSDVERSSHSDLNQFLTDASLAQILSNCTTPSQSSHKPNYQTAIKPSATSYPSGFHLLDDTWEDPEETAPIATVGSLGDKSDPRSTVLQQRQVMPDKLPASPISSQPASRSAERADTPKRKAKSSNNKGTQKSQDPQTNHEPKAKKPRKPRKSSKKTLSSEQQATKREIFLKRNREAAYKCRVKKKTHNDEILEKVKMLDADNAKKGLELEKLKREYEGLKTMLLPHYRDCDDERVVDYVEKRFKSSFQSFNGSGNDVASTTATQSRTSFASQGSRRCSIVSAYDDEMNAFTPSVSSKQEYADPTSPNFGSSNTDMSVNSLEYTLEDSSDAIFSRVFPQEITPPSLNSSDIEGFERQTDTEYFQSC
jgi:hypothetical protein